MKIFRKIRAKLLLNRNKNIKKYLLYAIGEIILVVIGILIALSLNNWKAEKERDKEEISLYKDLIEELKIDLGEIRSNKEYNAFHLSHYEKGSAIILSDKEYKQIDSLLIIAIELTKFSDFKSEGSAFQKLNLSGKIDLITDNDILNTLQNLGILYNYINRLEQNQTDFMYTIIPKLTEYIRYNPLQVMKPEKLYGYQFHNDIELIISICEEKDGLYKDAEEDLDDLIDMLKQKVR